MTLGRVAGTASPGDGTRVGRPVVPALRRHAGSSARKRRRARAAKTTLNAAATANAGLVQVPSRNQTSVNEPRAATARRESMGCQKAARESPPKARNPSASSA
jgi:hypothetical protein